MKIGNRIRFKLLVIIGLTLFIINSCSEKEKTDNNPAGDLTDNDGNIYLTIKIGSQTWMRENLKTTKYNDDSPIPLVTDVSNWTSIDTPGYCWYDNNEALNKGINLIKNLNT